MPNIEVDDIVQVSLVGSYAAQRILFTQTYRVSTAPTSVVSTFDFCGEVIDDITGGATALQNKYLACMPANYTLTQIRAQVIYPVRQVAVRQGASQAGTGSGAETGNTAGVITFYTDLAGRSQISNKHIGPLPLGASVNGALRPEQIALLDALGEEILEGFTDLGDGGEMTACIYHANVLGPIGKTTDMLGFNTQTTTRTMRRRTLGRGE